MKWCGAGEETKVEHGQDLQSRRREQGMAQVLTLVGAVPLMVAAGTLLTLTSNYVSESDQRLHRLEVQAVSAGGAHDALARLENSVTFRGEYELALGDGVARVAVTDWGTDGLDNNLDLKIDDADETDLIGIRSEGWLNANLDADGDLIHRPVRHYHSLTEAVSRVSTAGLGFGQSLYIDDSLAGCKFAGDSFTISGIDTNIDGTDGPAADVAGIGVPGDPADILSQLSKKQKDNIIGLGGWPSVLPVDEVDLVQTITELSAQATIRWTSDDSHTGVLGLQTPWVPVVAVAEGDLKVHGITTGAGILIVHGDLVIDGSFDFAGIVLVAGGLRFNGGGNKIIKGAIACLGSVDGNELEINGNVTLQYSTEAVEKASAALGKASLLIWMQR